MGTAASCLGGGGGACFDAHRSKHLPEVGEEALHSTRHKKLRGVSPLEQVETVRHKARDEIRTHILGGAAVSEVDAASDAGGGAGKERKGRGGRGIIEVPIALLLLIFTIYLGVSDRRNGCIRTLLCVKMASL